MLDTQMFGLNTIPISFRGYNKKAVEQKLHIIRSEYSRLKSDLETLAIKYKSLEESICNKNIESFELNKENNNLKFEINNLNNEINILKQKIHELSNQNKHTINNSTSYQNTAQTVQTVQTSQINNQTIINHNTFDQEILTGDVESSIIDEAFRLNDNDNNEEGFNFI